MNNQAAQTMPELPEKSGRATIKVSPGKYQTRDLYTADQMRQYARDYAAVISQTAGVPAARPALQCDDDGNGEYNYNMGWNDCRATMLAAAPSASGGEVWTREMVADVHRRGEELYRRIHGANPPPAAPSASGGEDGLDRVARRMGDSARALLRDIAEQQSAASVSERARELLAAVYEADGWVHHATDIRSGVTAKREVRALEQALTQQRGEWTPLDIQTFARAYKAEVPHAVLTVHGIDAGLHALTRPTTPQPGAEALREIYDAAAKGFHTSETNGAERKYLHVIRFQSIEDLHGYEDAWTAAMVKARDAK